MHELLHCQEFSEPQNFTVSDLQTRVRLDGNSVVKGFIPVTPHFLHTCHDSRNQPLGGGLESV